MLVWLADEWRFEVWKSTFFFVKSDLFPRIYPIIRQSRYRSHPVNSQKKIAIIFPGDMPMFTFFGADSLSEVQCFDCFECSLISSINQRIHVLSAVTKRCRKSFGLHLNNVKHWYKVLSRLRLLSGVRKRRTHSADGFLMPNISCRISPMRSSEVPQLSREISEQKPTLRTSWISLNFWRSSSK